MTAAKHAVTAAHKTNRSTALVTIRLLLLHGCLIESRAGRESGQAAVSTPPWVDCRNRRCVSTVRPPSTFYCFSSRLCSRLSSLCSFSSLLGCRTPSQCERAVRSCHRQFFRNALLTIRQISTARPLEDRAHGRHYAQGTPKGESSTRADIDGSGEQGLTCRTYDDTRDQILCQRIFKFNILLDQYGLSDGPPDCSPARPPAYPRPPRGGSRRRWPISTRGRKRRGE